MEFAKQFQHSTSLQSYEHTDEGSENIKLLIRPVLRTQINLPERKEEEGMYIRRH